MKVYVRVSPMGAHLRISPGHKDPDCWMLQPRANTPNGSFVAELHGSEFDLLVAAEISACKECWETDPKEVQ